MGILVRVLVVLLLVGLVLGVGAAVYNVGVSVGMSVASQAGASGDPVAVPYGQVAPYWHAPGASFFGIVFGILGGFLVLGLLAAAFASGRGGGGHGRRARLEELHRELHRADGSNAGQAAGS